MASDYGDLLARLHAGGAPTRLNRPAPAYTPRRRKRKKGLFAKLGGLPGEAFGLMREAPVGLIGFVGEGVKGAATGMPRLIGATIADVRRGDIGKAASRIGDVSTAGIFTEGARSYGFEGGYGAGHVGPMLATSAAGTWHRLTNPTEYARAFDEGRLVGTLVEDIGNLAIVGGAAAKALGAGARVAGASGNAARAQQLARASQATSRAARLGGRLADTPITAPVHMGGSMIRGGGRVARGVGEGLLVKTAPGTAFAKRHPFAANAAARAGRGASVAQRVTGDTAQHQTVAVLRRVVPDEVAAGKRDYTPAEVAEIGAATLLRTGEAGAFRRSAQSAGVTPERIAELGQRRTKERHTITPEMVRLAADYEAGVLAPDVATRIGDYLGALDEAVDIGTVREIAGTGTRPLSLDNQRQTPIPTVEAARMEFAPDMPDTPDLTRKDVRDWAMANDPNFTLDRWQRWHTTEQPLDPMLYPAAHRTTMEMLARADENLGGGVLAARPWDYTGQGATRTRYLPGGEFGPPQSARVGRKARGGVESTTGKFKRRPENLRTGEGVIPRTLEGIAGALTKNIESSTRNAQFDATGRAAGTTAATVIDQADLTAMHADAVAEAQATVGAGATPGEAIADVATETARIYGVKLREAMEAKGYEPWPERGDVLTDIQPELINDFTTFVPAGLRNAIGPYIEAPEPTGPLGVINAINTQWKGWVLPFSVRWQLGDGISNFLMSGLAGGISPAEYVRYMSVARRLRSTADGARLLEVVQNQTGLTREAGQWIYGQGNLGTTGTASTSRFAPVRALQKVRDASWHVNEVQNRAARSAVTLAKLDAELHRVNLGGIEGVGVERLARVQPETNPELWGHIRAAVDEASTVLGDMTNLPPWQRKWMRTIMPFWPWMRHVAQLTARLAIDDPIRLVFVMRLGDLVGTDDELPEYLQGQVRGPGGWWSTQFINPFADTGGLPGNPFGDNPAKAITAPMSPAIKWAAAALGQDFDEGGESLSMPWGTGWRDDTGASIPTILPLANPLGMLYRVAKSYPMARQLLDVLPEGEVDAGALGTVATGPVLRYDTGEGIRDSRGRLIRKDTASVPLLSRIGQAASIPTPTPDEVMEAARRRTRRRRGQPVGLLNT